MSANWYLEGVSVDGTALTRPMDRWPFRVGRESDNELVVPARGLSRHHAVFTQAPGDRLHLADLGSTNGTFVNRSRVEGACLVGDNDVIHFGNAEFRLTVSSYMVASDATIEPTMRVPAGQPLSGHFVAEEPQFLELLGGQGLSGVVQPIVDARSGSLFAYELLGRSKHPKLPRSPIQLFSLASLLGREADLSRAFRHHGIRAVAAGLAGSTLFVNTHPKETFEEGFLAELARLPREGLPVNLVVEVHETAVTEIPRMREFAARLRDLGVRFAYDDFGAGQARLNEIGEVPAHFVKFDMGLIHDIHIAPERKQKVVADLVRLVRELGSITLAEGVELEAEAVVCRQMGFELIQGYLTGRPIEIPSR